jgi:AmmeMemoRadiSam system protein B
MALAMISICASLGLAAGRGCAEERAMNSKEKRVVRKTYGDGKWFPANRRQLLEQISASIKDAKAKPGKGSLLGLISPHAGYVYSGKVAGHSFKALKDRVDAGDAPETVVVIGFSHRGPFAGIALMDGDAISTPLGETALDKEANEFLASKSDRIRAYYDPHAGEHSAENQIPFVQVAAPGAKLVVAMIGDHDGKTFSDLSGALVALSKQKRIVAVASTDLLHDPNYDLVTRTDKNTLARIVSMDGEKLAASWTYRNQVCCGIGPVLALVEFAKAKGCKEGVLLHYRNSGDDFPEGRGNWVVGYGAVSFSIPKP